MRSTRRALPALLATPALAQPLFNRPVRLVIGFAAGGAGDITVRMLAPLMQEELGQPIVVDNRPGAGGIVSGEFVARSAPDGHTCYLLTTSNMAAPAFFRTIPFDVTRDFAPAGRMVWYDHVIAVNPALPVRNLTELIALARARGGAEHRLDRGGQCAASGRGAVPLHGAGADDDGDLSLLARTHQRARHR